MRFIKERILFRGGISYGNAYVDPNKSMFLGEAVNKAYKLESEIAIHPRIVIEDTIAKAVLDNISSIKYKLAGANPNYMDSVFENNVLLTQTERLMMSGRPKEPKYARNKNILVIGGSGFGKTRFFVKSNLMQMQVLRWQYHLMHSTTNS